MVFIFLGLVLVGLIGLAFLSLKLHGKLSALSVEKNTFRELLTEQRREQQDRRERFDAHQVNSLKLLQESVQNNMQEVRQQITNALNHNAQSLSQSIDKLTQQTEQKLKEISGEVDKQLSKGFEKTTQTFTDVVKRLAIIDEAQKRITELSGNVVSLQEILVDKKSRGTFGEVQLMALIRNMIPCGHFEEQYTFSNGKRADCVLFLPEPTGTIAIDAKFPLETFRKLNQSQSDLERKHAEMQFRQDLRHHIKEISSKYILEGETAQGAMMFIPAEAIFAEIHAHFDDIVEEAQKARVWLASPTTLMAILTTARAVLKDAATRKQVHIIREHLNLLGKDFERFQKRMDNLTKHIDQAHKDVEEVHKSSRKITNRFQRIEKVEMETDVTEKIE